MSNLKLFRTYLITWPSRAAAIEKMGIDGEWHLATRDDPSFRHWSDATKEVSRFTSEEKVTRKRIRELSSRGNVRCKEILVQAKDEDTASNVSSLIQTGTLLGYPEIFNGPKYYGAHEATQEIEELMIHQLFRDRFTFQENALWGCRVAVAAWPNQSLRYAIEKYRLSLELDSFTPHSASPRSGQAFLNHYPEYSYHVRAATALILGFSIVEELGLEIRSSEKAPRWNDVGKAVWNPIVRENVENRLKEKGVNLSDPVYWIYRGEPLQLEIEIKPQLGIPAEYADGVIVRDRKLDIVEAIHNASYIRNFVVAHKYSELVSKLGPYDIHNIQLLARRLILSSLGLYKATA
jgi:hypothetical protein